MNAKIIRSVKNGIQMYLEEDVSYVAKECRISRKLPEDRLDYADDPQACTYNFMSENNLFVFGMAEDEKLEAVREYNEEIKAIENKIAELYFG